MAEELNMHFSSVFMREDTSSLPVPETKFKGSEGERLGQLVQTCQLSRVSRESHGFLHFLQSHGRGNSCSRVYSCPTVLFSHRLLPIIIAGNTFWRHKFSVK